MDIFFDVELMGDNSIDTHLFDIILALKRDISDKLSHLKEEIEADYGIIIIHFKPGHCGLTTRIGSPELIEKLNPILEPYRFEPIVKKVAGIELN